MINPDGKLEYDTAEALFVVSGMIGNLEEWLIGGIRLPPSDIASMLDRVLCKINNAS